MRLDIAGQRVRDARRRCGLGAREQKGKTKGKSTEGYNLKLAMETGQREEIKG